jgi:hypothetical protein
MFFTFSSSERNIIILIFKASSCRMRLEKNFKIVAKLENSKWLSNATWRRG